MDVVLLLLIHRLHFVFFRPLFWVCSNHLSYREKQVHFLLATSCFIFKLVSLKVWPSWGFYHCFSWLLSQSQMEKIFFGEMIRYSMWLDFRYVAFTMNKGMCSTIGWNQQLQCSADRQWIRYRYLTPFWIHALNNRGYT